MPLPQTIKRLFSFTAFQQSQGNNSFPGTQLDVELDQIDNTVSALIENVGGLVRADGALQNGIVTRNSLAADVLIGVGYARPWRSTISYIDGQTVTRGYLIYQAVADSTGVDPATDAAGARWEVVADLSQAIVIGANAVVTGSIADGAVTSPKLGTGLDGSKFADGSIPVAKIGAGLANFPVGTRVGFAGFRPPPGWRFENGAAVSRATYAALFNALSEKIICDVGAGQTKLLNVDHSIQGIGLRSAVVEGPGIPFGTRLVSDADGNLTMNQAAVAATVGAIVRIYPYGNGDGSTTFNLPDSRGRADFGRDDMGGQGAGRLVATVDGACLQAGAFDAGAGSETKLLKITNLPNNMPGGKVTVGYPSSHFTTFASLANILSAAQGAPVGNVWTNTQDAVGAPTVNQGDYTVDGANANPGGSQPFGIVPPAHVTNKIIYTGVLN